MEELLATAASATMAALGDVWDEIRPTLVQAVLALIGAGVIALKRKLDLAAVAATSKVEVESVAATARGETKTPAERKLSDAEREVIAALGPTFMGQLALRLGTRASIHQVLPVAQSMGRAASASMMPPSDGTPPPSIPKRSSASTDGFRAVLDADLQRPSGDVETIAEFDLPKDEATLEDDQ